MGEVQHATDAIYQHISARDQRVDRAEHDDVDDELQDDSKKWGRRDDPLPGQEEGGASSVTSLHRVSSPARGKSCRRPTCRRDSRVACGSGCLWSTRLARRAGLWCRSSDFPWRRAPWWDPQASLRLSARLQSPCRRSTLRSWSARETSNRPCWQRLRFPDGSAAFPGTAHSN